MKLIPSRRPLGRSVRTVMDTAPGVEGLVPFQEIEIKVVDAWKGDGEFGDRITLRVPGGPLPDGGGMLTVSSSPAVENYLDTPSIFFVAEDRFGKGVHGLCHRALGIYRVEKRPQGGALVRGVPGHPIARNAELDQVREQVREVVAPGEIDADSLRRPRRRSGR